MAKKTQKSIEEQIETSVKEELKSLGIHAYAKTEDINPEISLALSSAPSKSGGKGNNYPDIKVFLTTSTKRRIPVMIEVKGSNGDLIKQDNFGGVAMNTSSPYSDYIDADKIELAQAAEPVEIYQWNDIDKVEPNGWPQQETILIGCYRDNKHLEWILNNHIYNIRLGKRKESADSNHKCFNKARFLYLYDVNNLSNVSLYHILENKEMSGAKLKSMNYPKKSPSKRYMTFKIEKIDIENMIESINIKGVLEKLTDHEKGAPVFIESNN